MHMKILIFAGGFFPGKTFGGPPVSVDNFCSLMKEYDCYIVTSEHDNGTTERYSGIVDGWNDRGNAKVIYLSDKDYFSIRKLDSIVKEVKPEVIYLQSLFQDLTLLGLIVAKKNNIKVLLAPRGELCAGAFRKKYKKIPYIFVLRVIGLIRKIHFQSTSEEETEAIAKYLKAANDRIHYLTNIPSIPKREYSHSKKIPGEARFVFISRIHPKKNLAYALKCLCETKGKVQFDIYGPLEDKDYWAESQNIIRQLPENVKVEYKGLLGHDEVHETFSKYDAFFFPTLSENYGHVIAESLVVGTPVIISDQTPWNDVNEAKAGWAIPLSDEGRFVEVIQYVVDTADTLMSENALRFAKNKMKLDDIHTMYKTAFEEVVEI